MKSLNPSKFTATLSALALLGVSCQAAEQVALESVITAAAPQVEEQLRETEQLVDEHIRVADERIKRAKERTDAVKRSINLAQAGAGAFGGEFTLSADGDPFHQVGQNMLSIVTGPAKAAFRPLIVRTGKEDPEVSSDLQEDLSVMSRILTKAVGPETGRPPEDWAMGIAVTTLGGPRAPQSLYLEGFGALFLASVKFPLVAPPKPELEAKAGTEKDANWEEARQEVFGDGKARGNWVFAGQRPKIEYSAERVSDLKESLLESLKSAKNIRHLKADEWITVVVTGGDSEGGTMVKSAMRAEAMKAYTKAKGGSDKVVTMRAGNPAAAETSQLVIRVKKSDVDAFASGKLTAENFGKRAQIATY